MKLAQVRIISKGGGVVGETRKNCWAFQDENEQLSE